MPAWSTRVWIVIVAVLPVVVGCAGIHLDEIPVESLKATVPQAPLLPGSKAPLIVVATLPDGREVATKGAGHGKVRWDSFDIEPTVVEVTNKGDVRVPVDPRATDGKAARVRVNAKGHPGVSAEVDVPVRYDGAFAADFSGSAGIGGSSGLDGIDGSSGSSGFSADPEQPANGSDGGDGTDGGDGGGGGAGGDGQDVHVRVALKEVERPLLQVAVVGARGDERLFLVDPRGGSLRVSADGGPGGSGGAGGRGGRGGSGGSGSNGGSSGRSGSSGHDGGAGSDGAPGDGGTITVEIDPRARPYLGALHLSNRGYRSGPPPEIREEPVAPLW